MQVLQIFAEYREIVLDYILQAYTLPLYIYFKQYFI